MKRIILTISAVAILTGCGGKTPIPVGRLQQPTGEFSFVTPDGWSRTKLPGIAFIIVSTLPDFGARPNIFVDFVKPSTHVSNMVGKVLQTNRDSHRTYEVAQQTDFMADAGLTGVKISAGHVNKDALPIATYHYLIQDSDRVIVITASCADPVKQQYEPIFDKALKSLRSERKPTKPSTPTN
jgi:hypothetical protein